MFQARTRCHKPQTPKRSMFTHPPPRAGCRCHSPASPRQKLQNPQAPNIHPSNSPAIRSSSQPNPSGAENKPRCTHASESRTRSRTAATCRASVIEDIDRYPSPSCSAIDGYTSPITIGSRPPPRPSITPSHPVSNGHNTQRSQIRSSRSNRSTHINPVNACEPTLPAYASFQTDCGRAPPFPSNKRSHKRNPGINTAPGRRTGNPATSTDTGRPQNGDSPPNRPPISALSNPATSKRLLTFSSLSVTRPPRNSHNPRPAGNTQRPSLATGYPNGKSNPTNTARPRISASQSARQPINSRRVRWYVGAGRSSPATPTAIHNASRLGRIGPTPLVADQSTTAHAEKNGTLPPDFLSCPWFKPGKETPPITPASSPGSRGSLSRSADTAQPSNHQQSDDRSTSSSTSRARRQSQAPRPHLPQ